MKSGVNPVGSLLDFLGYPVYADLFKAIDWNTFYINSTVGSTTNTILAFSSASYTFFADSITVDTLSTEEILFIVVIPIVFLHLLPLLFGWHFVVLCLMN